MSAEITTFLKEQVYPQLNAVEAGLLDDLNPRKKGGGGRISYELNCPACGEKHRAFYYPGGFAIMCNRQNNCGVKTSLWDYLAQTGKSNSEIPKILADAAGVALPGNEGVQLSENKKLFELLMRVLKYSLTKSKKAQAYLKETRGWSDEEIEAAPIGFIYKWEYVYDSISKFDGDLNRLKEWGLYEPDPNERGRKGLNDFEGRIVGLWEQPDESGKLWGRLIRDPNPGEDKYKYQYGLVKDIPAYANHEVTRNARKDVVAVEGMLDVSRLIANGLPTIGLGGCTVSGGQVPFISKRYSSIVHWIDLDEAGMKGASLTIQKLSCAGVRCRVFYPDSDLGVKDADDAISKFGFSEALERFIGGVVSDNDFLSKRLDAFLSTHPETESLYQYVFKLSEGLCGETRLGFDMALREKGIAPPNSELDTLKILVQLCENGATMAEAVKIAKRKTGIEVTFS